MATEKESLRLLCKSIISRLENHKAISFSSAIETSGTR
jgi:hypothetical protein